MFNTQFIQEYLVLQDGISSTHLLGCILVFFPFTYLNLALDREVEQSSNLAS